jgi:hypothetical protein
MWRQEQMKRTVRLWLLKLFTRRRTREMTFKELVMEVADREGKKQEVDIAQIGEITKILLTLLAEEMFAHPYDTMQFLSDYTTPT